MRTLPRFAFSLVLLCLLGVEIGASSAPIQDGSQVAKNPVRGPSLNPPQSSVPADWPSPVEDRMRHSFFLADLLEYRPNGNGGDIRWDILGWSGGDYNRIWFKSEGNTNFKADYNLDFQLLYGRFVKRYYDLQIGARAETRTYQGRNVVRGHGVISLNGMVPYRFEIEPALFISQNGDVSARFTATKDFLLTQRLILQPRFDTNAAIQKVKKFSTGSGLNNIELGLRLRYEIRREIAPYVGISFDRSFGSTADLIREEGGDPSELRFVAGIRLWF